ncbi:uncharacterized protein LOC126973879 isoform X2 [Leptidea sinapis]|uniref:uncharacterized protein LOC126973879 isoform X2 n=1 Tax=Leptidea sinapis TaxID=189913 RepID=UPI0021C2B79F|nr:uncharacterized protein LOC126973879 isoform X2 [Leptidea sinapis]
MYTISLGIRRFIFLYVILYWLLICDGAKIRSKFKRKVDNLSDIQFNKLQEKNVMPVEEKRGFFGHGVFSLGKVLNFFPVGGERECQPSGYSQSRAGICLNPYDCRQREGSAAGDCAHGLGVCCVFEVTCGGVVQNNLTYFKSPGFPDLWNEEKDCNIRIEKTHAGIMQLRIDFVHFTIGQPNRITGKCDEDAMILGEGANNFTLCGQNHNQHMYYTLPSAAEIREADELPRSRSVPLVMRMRGADMPRLWLLRIAQIPLANTAPHDCLQYYTENNGTIRTFNYASNGRHLANQDYRSCVRRNTGYCSVRYTPCDRRSFRIGPGAGGESGGTQQMDQIQAEGMMPVNDIQNEDEGSGAEPQIIQPSSTTQAPGALNSSRALAWGRWSPYTQNIPEEAFPYYGYGMYGGFPLRGHGRQRCGDRVTIPCENEYFISNSMFGAGVCDPHHCGNNFCPGVSPADCHIETSITPFAVSVHFGPPTIKENPEENIGMCLRYQQISCNS